MLVGGVSQMVLGVFLDQWAEVVHRGFWAVALSVVFFQQCQLRRLARAFGSNQ